MAETDWKATFLKVYANLPFAAREEIIAVVDEAPFTWNSARIEIEQETEKGRKILEQLRALDILKNYER